MWDMSWLTKPLRGARISIGGCADVTMDSETLLREISEFCRRADLAESTFGRLAINDGKLVRRLRDGGRITTDTFDRIQAFIAKGAAQAGNGGVLVTERPRADLADFVPPTRRIAPIAGPVGNIDAVNGFRFYDNRQKYLLFVNTCSEKWVVAQRVSLELANVHPRPPALRVCDAGVGDGTVLARVMRAMHDRFPTMPHYVVGKEISLEDVRLTLDKMPDRFFEHPSTVLVMTNLYYSEAQIIDLQAFLAEHWRARVSQSSGNPVYERPVVLVIYREDHKFLLDAAMPRRGVTRAEYDLVIASQPYRARAPAEFKVRKVIAPLARSLAPGGRLLTIHSYGRGPGLEIVQEIWPGENPFRTDRHELLKIAKTELGNAGRDLNFNAYSDNRSIFRYDMHTLPSEISDTIGTSTLFAAWNAAIYVSEIEDQRLAEVISDRRYLDATRTVLQRHGGLWFFDESYVISRKRD